MRDDASIMVTDGIYSILEDLGVEAILIDMYEIRDSEQNFMKRMNYPIPHVLSNVFPKESEKSSPYAKLQQSYIKQIPGGRIFFINIQNPNAFQNQITINNHYDVIEPEYFIKNFVSQIGPNDVVVAKINLDSRQTADFLKVPESKRIDIILLSAGESRQFITEEEQELTKRPYGWVPQPKPEPISEEEANQPTQPPVGPPMSPETAFGSSDSGNVTQPGDTEQSGNQGGERINDEKDGENEKPDDAGSTPIRRLPENVKTPLSNENLDPSGATPPLPPKNPLGNQEINLKNEDRQYMDITNEYRIIPETHTAEFMREIHFKRTISGERTIKVSDIILYENVPQEPEIKKMADDIDKQQREMREKSLTLSIAKNIHHRLIQRRDNPYAGPDACKTCHPIAYEAWQKSLHAKALESLKKKKEDKNDACLKCHLTEWVRQSSWNTWEFDKYGNELGCESCHGPAKAHIELINTMMQENHRKYWEDVKKELPYLATEGPLSKAICLKCHDQANSPNFDFVKYWDMIIHDEPELSELPQPPPPEPVQPAPAAQIELPPQKPAPKDKAKQK